MPIKTILGIIVILLYFFLAVPAFADPGGRPEDLYDPAGPPDTIPANEENSEGGDNADGGDQDGSLNSNTQNSTVNSNNNTNQNHNTKNSPRAKRTYGVSDNQLSKHLKI